MLTSIVIVAALCSSPRLALVPNNTSPTTAEGVEILRRILGDALEQSFDHKATKETFVEDNHTRVNRMVTTLWAGEQTVRSSRAFHLPGVGMIFTIDTSLPVVAGEKEAPAAEKSPASDDEWERTRREVRGDTPGEGIRLLRPRFRTNDVQPEIDPAAIEKTIDVVLSTVARHSGRVEGLEPGETVTVALRLRGENRSWLTGGLTGVNGDALGTFNFGLQHPEDPDDPKTESISAYVLATGREAREQSLVIRIALSDLTGGEHDAAWLRKHAQINLY